LTRLERQITAVLRVGVFVSSLCLAAGLALSLVGLETSTAANLLLQFGLVALLATPVARVIVSTIEYVAERDWIFAALTLAVLVELMVSVGAALAFNRKL
jgi:uncharacterized membrane protein